MRRAPTLADFLENRPREAEAVVTDFRQFDPKDGAPVSSATTAYLSYDDQNLYVVFVCQDDPAAIRARLAKRKDIMSDDRVTINIDTFHDHKRAYFFDVNPYGVQLDGITTDGQGDDFSFETLWHTESKITETGYIVLEKIPFRSLRFPDRERQSWGIALARFIQRNNEMSCWPHVSRRRLPQFVGQFGDMHGIEGISGGSNLQMIPYGLFSSARFLDAASASGPRMAQRREMRAGLDAKTVLRDALTLDVTVNPDFSQVESDEPQVTINQRFEVFFPERRPFFTENAQFFSTPEELFFSRRIVDPQFGARLTGKIGRWMIGALAADDRAPDGAAHRGRAGIGVLRVAREFGRQSHIGVLLTDREEADAWNRVGSLDARVQLRGNWVATAQAITSDDRSPGRQALNGQAWYAAISNNTRRLSYRSSFLDRSPDFRADLGFIPRVDIREMEHRAEYRWRPEGRYVVSYGPTGMALVNWNRQGRVQDWEAAPGFVVEMPRLTWLRVQHSEAYELFRNQGYRRGYTGAALTTEWLKSVALTANYRRGRAINYYPAAGLTPFTAAFESGTLQLTLRPAGRLRLDEVWLYSRLHNGHSIYTNHILRSKVNLQFTRELSLRTILDYSAVLPNHSLVSLERAKRFNGDVLLTWMLHPGTALYAGYTSAYENFVFEPLERPGLLRTARPGMMTGRQLYVKLSYLLRF